MHPGRQLAVLGLLFVILYALVFFGAGAKGSLHDRLEPKLGLDLIGGTRATYVASLANGQAPPQGNMEESRKIIDQRVNALGVAEAEVVVEGDRNIVVSVAGENNDALKNVGQAAQMRFRKVLKATGDNAAVAANPPSASAAPSGSAAPKASAGASQGPKITGSAAPKPSTGGQGGGERAPSPSASASAPAPAPSATAEAPAPVTADVKEQRAAIEKKVGAKAWAAAEKLTDPVDLSTDPTAGVA